MQNANPHQEASTIVPNLNDSDETQQQVMESRDRLARILRIAHDPVISVDEACHITLFNQGAENVFGYREEEVLGESLDILIPDRLAETHRAHIKDFLASPVDTRLMGERVRISGRQKDGAEFPAEASISKTGPQGDQVLTVMLRDITQRVRTEDEIRLRSLEMEALFDIASTMAGPDSFQKRCEDVLQRMIRAVQADHASLVVADNPGSNLRVLAAAGVGSLGLAAQSFIPEGGGVTNEAFRRGEMVVVNNYPAYLYALSTEMIGGIKSVVSLPIRTGEKVLGLLNVTSLEVDYFTTERVRLLLAIGEGLSTLLENAILQVEAARSASEIRRLNEELEERVAQRTAQLQVANEELESFSYTVAHDLRAPLRAMVGFSGLPVRRYETHLPDEARHYLHRLQTNATQMGNLIDDLLAFSRLGQQGLRLEEVRPDSVARQSFEELSSENPSQHVELTIGDMPVCHADPSMLKEVFINLLGNALKYSSRRDPAIIEVGWMGQGGNLDEVVYCVRDNGGDSIAGT